MLSCYLMERRQRQRNPPLGNDLGKARFDQAFEPYRTAFIVGDLHEKSFILNEFVSSLLSAEDSKLAEEQALSSSLCSEEDKSLEEILTCRLCRDVFHVPVTLVCGHTFCLDCLNCQQSGNRTVCPGCGKESSLHYSPNIVVRDLSRMWFSEKTYIRGCCIEAKRLLSEGKIVAFMNLLENILTKYPENSELLLLRSHGYKYMQNYREALKDIDFACSLAPFNGKLFHARGELLASIDKPEEAVAMFLRASALKPNDPTYRSALTSYLDKLLRNVYDVRMSCSPKSSSFNGGDHESTTKRVMKSLPIKSMSNMDEIAATTRRNNASGKPVCESELTSGLGCRSKVRNNVHTDVKSTEKTDNQESVCCKTNDVARTDELQEGSGFQSEQSKSIVPSELECKLCFNMLYEPVTTPCGHSLCRSCLHRCLDHRFDCPCCRSDLQSYLEQIMMANIGTCEVLHRILLLKFKDDYEARRNSYVNELKEFSRCESNKDEIPIFVCTLAVPGIACPLHIFEPRYKLMIRRCLESGSRQFGMCVSDAEHGFATVGTMLYINDATFLPDGRSVVHTIGSRRFKVLERGLKDGYNTAKVAWLEDECDESDRADLNNQVYNMMVYWFVKLPREQQTCIVKAVGEMPDPLQRTKTNGPKWLWWLLAAMPLNVEAKSIILSMTCVTERLNSAKRFLAILISRQ